MKRLMLIIHFLCVALASKAQAIITLNILSDSATYVKVSLPLHGGYFNSNFKIIPITKGSNTITLRPDAKGLLRFKFDGQEYQLFAGKEGKYDIKIDHRNNMRMVEYSGTNHDGQQVINNLKRESADVYLKNISQRRENWADIVAAINSRRDEELRTLRSLGKQKKLNQSFLMYATTESKDYYAYLTTYFFYKLYFNIDDYKLLFNLSSQNDAKKMMALWSEIYKSNPPNLEEHIVSKFGYEYVNVFANFYQALIVHEDNLDQRRSLTAGTFYLFNYNNFKFLEGKVQVYACARFISEVERENNNEHKLATMYRTFRSISEHTEFRNHFSKNEAKLEVYLKKMKQPLPNDQLIVKNYLSIKSLDSLKSIYKNKTVYVDIWATWCAPCVAEFRQNDMLKEFAKNNNVDLLYLSIDEERVDQLWSERIRYYNLSGLNMRASAELYKDIIKKLGTNGGIVIPRYLIIKNGVIVNDNALRPSDGERLINQLKE